MKFFFFLAFSFLFWTNMPFALNVKSLDGIAGCDSIPDLNKQILKFVKDRINTKVGRGECWDLAAEALNALSAGWNKKYEFGRKIDIQKECVCPGDIIQFNGVKVEYQEGNRHYTETLAHHTAIVYEVKAPGVFVLAHQNTAHSGKKVGLSDLNLKNITKGKITLYRPVKQQPAGHSR